MKPIAEIKQIVAEHYGVTVQEIESKDKHERIAIPRMVAVTLCWEAGYRPYRIACAFYESCSNKAVTEAVKRIQERESVWKDLRTDLPLLRVKASIGNNIGISLN